MKSEYTIKEASRENEIESNLIGIGTEELPDSA